MNKNSVLSVLAGGMSFGALLYGGPLAWIHGAHNLLSCPRDSAVVWIAFCFLYGAWGAAAFAGGSIWARLLTYWRRSRLDAAAAVERHRQSSLYWGIFAFNLAFWEPYFLYGLTYDQVPLRGIDHFLPMAVYLAAAAVLIALGVAAGSWVLFQLFVSLGRRHWLRPAILVAFSLWGIVMLAQPWWTGAAQAASDRAASGQADSNQDEPDPDKPDPDNSAIEVGGDQASQAAPAAPLSNGDWDAELVPEADGTATMAGSGAEEPGIGTLMSRPLPSGPPAKVVLIGLDGADWRVIDPLLRIDALPAFARLLETGARASLDTFPDANSAVIWASIYSGRSVEAHGIHDFYRVEIPGMGSPGLYPVHRTFFKELSNAAEPLGLVRRTLVSRFSMRSPLLWEIADHEGISTGVVDGYLYSFPAPTPTVPESYFLAYGLDAFAASVGGKGAGRTGVADLPLFLQPTALFRGLRDILDRGDFYWQSAALLRLLEERPQPGFVNFYTHEPDSMQHQQWKWYEPEHYFKVDAEQIAEKKDAIPDLHRDFDTFLGDLQEKIDPETVVVIASDHGHSPTPVHKLFTQHRHGPPGILVLAGGPIREGIVLDEAHVLDVFPTLLYLLGLPIPEDAEGEVLWEALDPAFVAKHPAKTIPSFDFLNKGYGDQSGGLGEDRNQQELEKLKSLGYI